MRLLNCIFLLCLFHSKIFAQNFAFNKELFKDMPIHNQSTLGTCYAHSPTQIFNVIYNEENHTNRVLSPLMLALAASVDGYKRNVFQDASLLGKVWYLTPIFGWINYAYEKIDYKSNNLSKMLHGGGFCSSAKSLKQKNICEWSDVEGSLDSNKDLNLQWMMELVNQYYNKNITSIEQLERLFLDHNLSGKIASSLQSLFHFLETYKMPLAYRLDDHFKKQLILEYFRNKCDNMIDKIDYSKISCKDYGLDGNDAVALTNFMESHFSSTPNPSPIGFSYCFHHLNGNTECGNHSSIIYGTYKTSSETYFLVRNSWGGKPSRVLKKQTPIVTMTSHHDRQDLAGDFWLSSEALRNKFWDKEYGHHISILSYKK